MKFALNYSRAAARLFNDGIIAPDLFKCPDFPHMIAEARIHLPVVVHFPHEIGPSQPSIDLEEMAALAQATDTHLINTHLVCRRQHHPHFIGHAHSQPENAEFTQAAIQDLQLLLEKFPTSRVIIVNLIFHGPPALSPPSASPTTPSLTTPSLTPQDDWLIPGTSADVFHHIITTAQCGFLLDLSHARIAAHYLQIDPQKYIESLPVQHLRELHLTGLAMHNGLLTDHMPLTDEDWHFTRWALDQIRLRRWAVPQVIASEYGGEGKPFSWRTDPDVIAQDTPLLYDLAHEACT